MGNIGEKFNSQTKTCECDTASGFESHQASFGNRNFCIYVKDTNYNTLKAGNYLVLGYNYGDLLWRVLDVDQSKRRILIILDGMLNSLQYREFFDNSPQNYDEVTWENSTIRYYLNNKWINTTFDDNEKKLIVKVTNKTEDNPESGIDGGKDTQDMVFLLSYEESKKYNAGMGWLRTPGNLEVYFMTTSAGESSDEYVWKNRTYDSKYATTQIKFAPAMWVSF